MPLFTPPAPAPNVGRIVKIYATQEEVDAAGENGVSELGIFRLPASGAQAFFGGSNAVAYMGGDVVIRTIASDGYGDGYPPTPGDYSGIHQWAEMVDGYGASYTFFRVRSWNASAWAAWGNWTYSPQITSRPGTVAGGLWYANNSSHSWRSIQGLDSVAYSAANIPNAWQTAFAEWDVSETMRLVHGATPVWENNVATLTDFGTQSYTRRVSNPANQRAGFSRLTWEAAEAANAVAGFHLPLDAQSNRHGDMLVASFAIEPTAVATAQLFFGFAQTSGIATVMGDVSMASLSVDSWSIGYDNDDTTFKYYGIYVGTQYPYDTGIPVTRNAGQIVTVKERRDPGSGSVTIQLIVTNASAGTKSVIIPQNRSAGPWYQPVSAFLRASAGGTSMAPKVHLMQFQYGFGISGGGGH